MLSENGTEHDVSNHSDQQKSHAADADNLLHQVVGAWASDASGVGTATSSASAADFHYRAFISYRHLKGDHKHAKWLHNSLETYEVPDRLRKSHGLSKRVGPCFLDEEELPAASHLSAKIEQALRDSRYLIVVCSPNTPGSLWVRREISTFRQWGRTNQILSLLIDGEPRESFPEELCEIRSGIREDEPLAADVRFKKDERQSYVKKIALLKLLAAILGVDFAELRNREHEREAHQARVRTAVIGVASTVALAVIAMIVWALWARVEALKAAEAARIKQEAAETQKWRSALDKYHAQTDSRLSTVMALRNATDRPDAPQTILETIGQVSSLRKQALGAERALSDRGQLLITAERHSWERQVTSLRNEATQALARIRLQRGRSVPLPEGPYEDAMPTIAIRADQQQIALVYPSATSVLVLGRDGERLHRLPVPEDFAAATLTTSTVEHGWGGARRGTILRTAAPSKLLFVTDDCLQYQAGREVLSWTISENCPRRAKRGSSPASSPFQASSERYLATTGARNASVSLCEWGPDARPLVVWQNKDADNDNVKELAFSSDGRALFVRSGTGLTLVDGATGATAREDWPGDKRTTLVFGTMVPYRLGMAIVERRTVDRRPAPLQLVFWHAVLPRVEMRVLHHDELPASLDWAADGWLVSGAADHLVRAWKGRHLEWASGIPYAGREKGLPSGRFPSVDFPSTDVVWQTGFTWAWHGIDTDWRRVAWSTMVPQERPTSECYRPPDPYAAWGFLRDGTQPLLVTHRVLIGNGRSQERTELYSPEDGRRLYAFPVEGNGRLWETSGISPDRRFALVVAGQSDGHATLEICSLPDRKVLGRLDRPIDLGARLHTGGILPRTMFLSSGSKDWLLASYPHATGIGVDLEIWRLPEVHLVGTVLLPTFHTNALITQNPRQAYIFGGNRWFPPMFYSVVDLETAKKICDLENAEHLSEEGRLGVLFNGEVNVVASKDVVPSDPYHVFAWNLTTGKRTELGKEVWTNETAPQTAYSPSGDRLLVCGNVHDSGMAHAELWTLPDLKLLQEATFPTKAVPYVADIQGTHCSIELIDFPDKDKHRLLHWRWADGQDLLFPPADAPRLAGFAHDLRHNWNLLIWWQPGSGLALQQGTDKPLVRLENTGGGGLNNKPALGPDGKIIAFGGAHGGFWDAVTGREIARFSADDTPSVSSPADRLSPGTSCFDATGRWAMTLNAAKKEISVWDLETGKIACRCRPSESSDPPFDPTQASFKLHPGGKRLAVLWRGVLQLWDLEHNRQVMGLDKPGHFTPVTCVAQHAGTSVVASAGAEGVILLWNRKDGRLVRTFFANTETVHGLAFTIEGRQLAVMSERSISLFELDGRVRWTYSVPQLETSLACLLVQHDGSFLSATRDGRLLTIDAKTGCCLANPLIDRSGIDALALSPDGKLAAIGTRSGRIYLWDTARREVCRKWWDTYAPVAAAAFVGGSGLLAAGGGQSVQFFETAGGQLLWTLEIPHGPVHMLLVNEQKGELAVVGGSEEVVIFNLPHLAFQLERLELGFPEFPRGKWPAPREPAVPSKPSWKDWQEKARQYRYDKELSAAHWACSRAIAMKPNEWQLWNAAGEMFNLDSAPKMAEERASAHGWWRRAVRAFSKAIELNPGEWRIWRNRAEAFFRLREWHRALDDYRKAIELDAKRASLWYGRGLVYHELRRYDDAIADFDHTVSLDPDFADAIIHRGDSLRRKGEFDRAIADLTGVLQKNRRLAMALAVRSAAFRGKGDLSAALNDVNEAIRFQADFAYAYTQRGEIYRQQKQYDLALADLDEAVALDRECPTPHLSRGLTYAGQGRLTRAVIELIYALELEPDNPLTCQVLGEIQMLRHEYDAAVACFDRAARLAPLDPASYHRCGSARAKKGDWRRAIADYDEAIRLKPTFDLALLDRGAAEIVLNQSDKALADFDKAAQVSPKSHLPFVYCGQFYSAHRRYDKAVAEFSRAVDLKTDDVGSLRGRGHAYAELGRWERATADFSATARLNPGDALDQYWLVYALLGSKKRSEARVACDAMLKRFRTTKKPVAACLVTLGGVLVSGVAKDAEPYLQIIEKAAAANPKDYGFACAWGAALYRCGRFEKAGGELTGAGALNSRNDAPFDLLLLAMVHAKSGHPTKARRCLDNAVRWIEQRAGGGAETSDRLPPWQTRLQLELLRHEAETLLTPLEKGDGAERHAPRN